MTSSDTIYIDLICKVMTWATIDEKDIIVLYALSGQSVEAVLSSLRVSASPTTTGSSIKAKSVKETVQITGTASETSVVSFGSTMVIIVDKETASTFWNPRLAHPTVPFDASATVPSVIVMGPYLVRNASITDSTLSLFGDINATSPITFIAPKSVKQLTWNRKQVPFTTDRTTGFKSGSLEFSLSRPSIPDLQKAKWTCVDSLPEIQSSFDDSSWVNASKTSTQRPLQPFAGEVCFSHLRWRGTDRHSSSFCMLMSMVSIKGTLFIVATSLAMLHPYGFPFKGTPLYPTHPHSLIHSQRRALRLQRLAKQRLPRIKRRE